MAVGTIIPQIGTSMSFHSNRREGPCTSQDTGSYLKAEAPSCLNLQSSNSSLKSSSCYPDPNTIFVKDEFDVDAVKVEKEEIVESLDFDEAHSMKTETPISNLSEFDEQNIPTSSFYEDGIELEAQKGYCEQKMRYEGTNQIPNLIQFERRIDKKRHVSIEDQQNPDVFLSEYANIFVSHVDDSGTCRLEQSVCLNSNIQKHGAEKTFKCDYCSARFALKHHLVSHFRTHTGEKPFECDSCSAKFARKGDLNSHIRTHTGEKPFKCDSCSASFAKKSNLNSHFRKHTGEKPFKCFSCTACFTEKGNLNRHLRIHKGERPFKCDICSAKFARKSDLNSHILTRNCYKPIKCSCCPARFVVKSSLARHFRKHINE